MVAGSRALPVATATIDTKVVDTKIVEALNKAGPAHDSTQEILAIQLAVGQLTSSITYGGAGNIHVIWDSGHRHQEEPIKRWPAGCHSRGRRAKPGLRMAGDTHGNATIGPTSPQDANAAAHPDRVDYRSTVTAGSAAGGNLSVSWDSAVITTMTRWDAAVALARQIAAGTLSP